MQPSIFVLISFVKLLPIAYKHKQRTETFRSGFVNIEVTESFQTSLQELAMIEDANNRLRRMENRLDIATKRFCVVNANNKGVREEIHRLLVERYTLIKINNHLR